MKNRISRLIVLLRALLPSVYFCLKYLPFRQAIKLPILIYKPRFLQLKGSVMLESEKVHFGMIKLGFFTSALYPDADITIRNEGEIIFKGKCRIGNDCYVICGKHGRIEFGEGFTVTAGLKLVSECGITFGKDTWIGWGGLVIDTNFHPLYDTEKKAFRKAFGKIRIGDNNWFGTGCVIMPRVQTPERCIFGARTVVTRGGQYEPCCVHGGSPVRVLSRNVMLIIGQPRVKDYAAE